ncbi:MAG: metal-dependent hydrolase [Methanoculleaceae archaeon]
MELKWLGHSCVALTGSSVVLIDPFTGGRQIDVDPDIVAVTHGHADHLGETLSLARKTVAINGLAKWLSSRGIDAVGMNIGGTAVVDGVSFTMTEAIHSGWLEGAGPGFCGGGAAGFVIEMDGVRVYHAGDTALFSDMKLIGQLYRPDVACLPIGGHYTMGPREAMMAATFVEAPVVVPIHYNTFPVIEQDAHEFKRVLEETTNIRVEVPEPGGSIEIGKKD